ncbi:MAG: transposase [Spirochaetaceae bacterium]|jgi:transposase-like protein|nr:transposase [Spirochaetaceae bacterium]
MGTKDKERRVYTREFNAEAPAEKSEKPIGRIAADLGINENMPRRWTREARDSGGTGLPPLSGHGRPRDEEPSRLRKEVKAPREAVRSSASLEILKKAAKLQFASSSRRQSPLTVARLMRENGLNARQRRKFIPATNSNHGLPVC